MNPGGKTYVGLSKILKMFDEINPEGFLKERI